MSAMVVFLQTLKSNHTSSFYPLFNVRLSRRIAYLTRLDLQTIQGQTLKPVIAIISLRQDHGENPNELYGKNVETLGKSEHKSTLT
jgi:hypothetical protein